MPGGYAVSPAAIDRYVRDVLDPALENYTRTAEDLQAARAQLAQGFARCGLLGQARLPGSSRFTQESEAVFTQFAQVYGELAQRQAALVRNVAAFRSALLQASAMYARTEDEHVQLLNGMLRDL